MIFETGKSLTGANAAAPDVTLGQAVAAEPARALNLAPEPRKGCSAGAGRALVCEKVAVAHHDISDADVERMRTLFSDAEFLELTMMTGQYIGFGRVLALLQLEVASCPV